MDDGGRLLKRRTISLPEGVDALIRELALPDEAYSATVARLVEEGAKAARGKRPPAFVGVADGDVPVDLSVRAEHYLRELFAGG